jgi:hypothetical protein
MRAGFEELKELGETLRILFIRIEFRKIRLLARPTSIFHNPLQGKGLGKLAPTLPGTDSPYGSVTLLASSPVGKET